MKKLGIVAAVVLGCAFLFWILGAYHYPREAQQLENAYTDMERQLKALMTQGWEVLKTKADVKEEYKEDFQEVMTGLIAGRYNNARGGALWSFIQESNPNFDSSLYKDIAAAVESIRMKYVQKQELASTIKRMHDNIRTTPPGKWFIGGRAELKIVIITSQKVDEIFETGHEEHENLFEKK